MDVFGVEVGRCGEGDALEGLGAWGLGLLFARAGLGFFSRFGYVVRLPFVHGDRTEEVAAGEAVVRESFRAVEVREVGHGFVGEGGQGGSFDGGDGVGRDVAEVALFVGE